jgi:hypothetical protein
MQTWLLLTLDESERIYHGNLGYDDDIRTTYRFDNSVPSSSRVAQGDIAIIRGKSTIHGSALITSLTSEAGTKTRQRCPQCDATHLKQRKTLKPLYRCQCGAEFDVPKTDEVAARLYTASFGTSFTALPSDADVRTLWDFAPRLNKQFAILELDTAKTQQFLTHIKAKSPHPAELPVAATTGHEGGHQTVSVNRYERDDRLRQACIDHYGCRCFVCGYDFSVTFGADGAGVIEVHHLTPLATVRGVHEVDAVRDLRPLCPNCHTMAHRREPPYTMDALKTLSAESAVKTG